MYCRHYKVAGEHSEFIHRYCVEIHMSPCKLILELIGVVCMKSLGMWMINNYELQDGVGLGNWIYDQK